MTCKASLAEVALRAGGRLLDARREVPLVSLRERSCLPGKLEALRHRSVIVLTSDQLLAAMLVTELDGVARRMVLCPADLAPEHLPHVIRCANADACVSDASQPKPPVVPGLELVLEAQPLPQACPTDRRACCETEWVLLTSGTTGAPKLVVHTLRSLTHAFAHEGAGQRLSVSSQTARSSLVWSTFYDIRRYGGLQILLRALLSGSLALPSAGESMSDFLARASALGVTHISGTPSHWRQALMSGATNGFSPEYVRLSGEIADQAILDALRAAFPRALIAHAFASTEAGVGFEVEDGLAGFPASVVGRTADGVELDVSRGTLRIRSPGNATRYLGAHAPPLRDAEGFVDMGDRLELREGRYYFAGRRGGIINVGGQKVYPEEVEAVINAHPLVRMSRVSARRSSVTGALVAAEVVLIESGEPATQAQDGLCLSILDACRRALPPHKVPATIRIVPFLEISASGKLVRADA